MNITFGQNTIQCGLGTLTCTIPATINNVAVAASIFNVKCQVTVPSAVASANGAGGPPSNGRDLGLGATGGFQGIGQGSNLSPGQGGTGLGFGGTNTDGAAAPIQYAAVSSSLSIVVNQNGTPVYTAPALTPTQAALQFEIPLVCNAADVITVVLSSSNANDETLQAIKANVSVGSGA